MGGETQLLGKGSTVPMWVLVVLAGVLSYIGKESLNKLEKVDRSVQDLRLEMAREYVTKDHLKEVIENLKRNP